MRGAGLLAARSAFRYSITPTGASSPLHAYRPRVRGPAPLAVPPLSSFDADEPQFVHLVHLRFGGEAIELRVWRARREETLHVPVQPLGRLVPATVYDAPQPYFLYAGLVFLPLTEPYLHEWGDDWQQDAPTDLVHLCMSGTRREAGEEVVVLSRCYPSRHTAGYTHLNDRQVHRCAAVWPRFPHFDLIGPTAI